MAVDDHANMSTVETDIGLPHKRIESDRRGSGGRGGSDRRTEPRREPELRQHRQVRDFGRIGTAAAGLGALIGIWALVNAPVTKSATVCTDTFGGELLHHREIHPLWIASMMMCAVAIALPTRPRRSYVSVGLVGLTFGLAVAAYIRVRDLENRNLFRIGRLIVSSSSADR